MTQEEFDTLTTQWKTETGGLSSITQIIEHDTYRQIIAAGESALPFIFADLAREPDFWFAAMREITGHNPVPEEARGNIQAMRELWLLLGELQGYWTKPEDFEYSWLKSHATFTNA